jgi:predicted nucleic acid-binding protein
MSFLTAGQTPRVVLDSNVWIDILVFDDPHTRPIAAALAQGQLDAIIDARCLAELTRVLDYPQFARFAVNKEAALAQVGGWTTMIPPLDVPQDGSNQLDTPQAARMLTGPPDAPGTHPIFTPLRPLPKCRDRDDQKFLELAQRAGAAWLVSKDRELLRMAKRIARDFGFSIGLPDAFTASFPTSITTSPTAL